MGRPSKYPETPDGRYFVSKSRMWRKTDPSLPDDLRKAAVSDLMKARRAVRFAETEDETAQARARVQDAKVRLGERGPVWWDDGAEDVTRHAPWTTDYADWWAGLSEADRARGS